MDIAILEFAADLSIPYGASDRGYRQHHVQSFVMLGLLPEVSETTITMYIGLMDFKFEFILWAL